MLRDLPILPSTGFQAAAYAITRDHVARIGRLWLATYEDAARRQLLDVQALSPMEWALLVEFAPTVIELLRADALHGAFAEGGST